MGESWEKEGRKTGFYLFIFDHISPDLQICRNAKILQPERYLTHDIIPGVSVVVEYLHETLLKMD